MNATDPGPLTRRTLLKLTASGAALAGIAETTQSPTGAAPVPEKQKPLSNDTAKLEPHINFDPPRLTFDFPALQIGVAEYPEGPTGCTVFSFGRGAACAADIRGGAPGTIGNYGWVNAICLAGGSLYGLEAATGVTAELFAQRDYSHHWDDIPLVNGAIVYDFARDNSIYPDKALGRAAFRAARPGVFPLGRRGAGSNTGCGGAGAFAGVTGEKAGQGGAFRQAGPTKIVVFSVVNALGALVDRQGKVVRGNRDPKSGRRYHYHELVERKLPANGKTDPPRGNTTLTLVVTNQKVGRLEQLARQVHASMSRVIQPFHTENDGDVLYAITTGEVENAALSSTALGSLASELAWDAVLSCFEKDAAPNP
jgi:L-aminopeptidase/D-esterase-like protein